MSCSRSCVAGVNQINCLFSPFFHVNSSVVDICPEVLDALANNRPVVALESTIITHGMPHPHNWETATEVEKIVREQVNDELPSDMNCEMTCYAN
jgi:hypothetical protein